MNYKYFVHRDCCFFPCHDLTEWRSCLFCWCPLYLLDCGGDFTFKNGIKDCSNCTIPHTGEGYDYVLQTIKGMRQTIVEIFAARPLITGGAGAQGAGHMQFPVMKRKCI